MWTLTVLRALTPLGLEASSWRSCLARQSSIYPNSYSIYIYIDRERERERERERAKVRKKQRENEAKKREIDIEMDRWIERWR